jgi:hypothetical protein
VPSSDQVRYWQSPEGKQEKREYELRRRTRLMRTLTILIEDAEKEIAEHGEISRSTRSFIADRVAHVYEKTPDALVIERAKKRAKTGQGEAPGMNDLEFLDHMERTAKNGGPVTYTEMDRLYFLKGWGGCIQGDAVNIQPWLVPVVVKLVEEARAHIAAQVKERLKS